VDVFEAIKKRRSIRTYQDKSVEEDKLNQLLEAARLAPSAKNRQNWMFIVVKDKQIREQLVLACNGQKFVGEAPIVIAGVADPTLKWYRIDMGIAVEHIALEAMELELGTCWVGAFDEKEVSRILRVPTDHETVILITIGYPKVMPPQAPRKKMDDIVRREFYH